jgi:hypothetical protein
MRARQRHLNKSLRETACAFDSRLLSGFSDGNEVDTWTDLSANGRNATQSTSSKRPLYKTAIQGGNPVLRFDGSNDALATGTFASTAEITVVQIIKANAWTSLPTQNRFSGGHGFGVSSLLTTGIDFFTIAQSTALYWQVNDLYGFGNGYNNTDPKVAGPSSSGSDFRIISTVFWSSLSRIYANGVRVSTRAETTASISAFTRELTIGAFINATNEFWLGDIGAVIYFQSNIGEPMRARIERSNALAFKIACS